MNLRRRMFLLILLAAFLFQPVIVTSRTYESEEEKMEAFQTPQAYLASIGDNAKTIENLIKCESGWKNVKIVDINGYYSYGILQFQKRTWQWFSELSGIQGDPMNQKDAIRMTNWAIDNGFIKHWSCAKKYEM